MKILEYIHMKPDKKSGYSIAYRVYDLYNDPDSFIDCGYFHGMDELISYTENNDITEYQDVTYKFFGIVFA